MGLDRVPENALSLQSHCTAAAGVSDIIRAGFIFGGAGGSLE